MSKNLYALKTAMEKEFGLEPKPLCLMLEYQVVSSDLYTVMSVFARGPPFERRCYFVS